MFRAITVSFGVAAMGSCSGGERLGSTPNIDWASEFIVKERVGASGWKITKKKDQG